VLQTEPYKVVCSEPLDGEQFTTQFVEQGRPVLLEQAFIHSGACQKWDLEYFARTIGDMAFIAKHFEKDADGVTSQRLEQWLMTDYVTALQQYAQLSKAQQQSTPRPPYCHDIPIFKLKPQLIEDMADFPRHYIPAFYRDNWWDYVQFFLSPQGSVTPLHFDSLRTHNLFFQVKGVKKFTLFDSADYQHCYRHHWKWFEVDPLNPDLLKYPDYAKAQPTEILVKAGDILLMPAGTLHHVQTLQESISFNIDFHTKTSVMNALTGPPGDPPERPYYFNSLIALGLMNDVSPLIIYPRYEGYLYYTGEG
jgi:hypothetical protein